MLSQGALSFLRFSEAVPSEGTSTFPCVWIRSGPPATRLTSWCYLGSWWAFATILSMIWWRSLIMLFINLVLSVGGALRRSIVRKTVVIRFLWINTFPSKALLGLLGWGVSSHKIGGLFNGFVGVLSLIFLKVEISCLFSSGARRGGCSGLNSLLNVVLLDTVLTSIAHDLWLGGRHFLLAHFHFH